MDAFRPMTFGDLPPAGNAVRLRPRLPLPVFAGYRDLWLNSGTAALALAFLHAHWQRLEIRNPEVVLPAYGCPDLVSAAVYAGLRPVLADIDAADPAYDLSALEAAINENTVAVVAVNFLGIAERLEAIRKLLPPDTVLVEDNAQWHPEPDVALKGEYVVTSFGRGKPASVLGGGLLLIRKDMPLEQEWIAEQLTEAGQSGRMWRHSLKAIAYNALRTPPGYFCVNRSGLFKLGQTRYRELQRIASMDSACEARVAANVQEHLLQDRWREAFYDAALADIPDLLIIAPERRRRLLRYPLLCAGREQRDLLLQTFNRQGLGASPLYQRALAAIPGVADKVVIKGKTPAAASFANRLLTLPLHSGVSAAHLEKIVTTLQRFSRTRHAAIAV